MDSSHVFGRMLALIMSALVSLVSGTPYLYGIYAPQLVQRVGLSTSDAATISLAVTIGSGLGGLPAGLFIDHYGPQKAILLGSITIFLGYFSLNRIYDLQIGSLSLVCISMTLIGFGSVTSFFAGLKAAQANFPDHRGSAGALPVGAYGLAATIFSLVAATFFSDNTGGLLAFLAYFCGSVAFVGSWFIHIYDPPTANEEAIVLVSELEEDDRSLTSDRSLRGSFSFWGIGKRTPRSSFSLLNSDATPLASTRMKTQASLSSMNLVFAGENAGDETARAEQTVTSPPADKIDGPLQVIKGLLTDKTYLTHYVIIALCSGIGQMYIYTVGFIVRAQISSSSTLKLPSALQAIQVSTISIASFGGRIIAGLLSDYLYKQWKAQRQWVILGTIWLIGMGQVLLIWTNSLNTITVISAMIGGGYGLLNGTYPAIIADTFGTKTFTTAWGLTCSGPLVFLFILEKYFGYIYDSHLDDKGACTIGNDCYRGAFEASAALCVLVLGITLALMFVKRRDAQVSL